MMAHDLIIFDCDGTLVDSEYLNNKACADALAKNGAAYELDEVLVRFGGMTMTNIAKIVLDERGVRLPENFVDDFIELARTYKAGNLKAVTGALPAVRELTQSYKTCVASNGERGLVFESLHMTAFDALFDEAQVFTRIQVAQGKPAPDLFLYAAEQMEARPDRCLVIEDSPTGVLAAVAAKMDVIGFTGATHDPGDVAGKLRSAGADIIFTNWDDILHYIKGLTGQKMAL